MRLYANFASVSIWLGDSLEHMEKAIPEPIDLIVTDPPYGVSWQSGRRTEKFSRLTGDDSSLVGLAGIQESLRFLKNNRHVYVFGRFDLSSLPIGGRTELIWDKGMLGPGDLSLPWGPQHEPIQFGVFIPSKANRGRGDGRLAARLRKGSVLRDDRLNSKGVKLHPTEKPVNILRELIESSSCLGETVLDPFCGSGSTLEAALREGRSAIGIEIEEKFCEITAKRLEKL